MVLENCHFVNNIADVTGGALHSSTPDVVNVDCRYAQNGNGRFDVSLDNSCPLEWIGNKAKTSGGGNVWSTTPVFIEVCNATGTCIGEGEELHVTDHNSGHFLEPITVRMLDAFKRLVILETGIVVRVTTNDNNVSLTGERIAEGANVNLRDIRLQANVNKTYNLTLKYSPPYFARNTIAVQVRACKVGEVQDLVGQHCNRCGEGQFSLNTSQECSYCPAHADCGNSTITLELGFWHSTSKSLQIHVCVVNESCSFRNRSASLAENASIAHGHGSALDYQDIINYRQCSQVSEVESWPTNLEGHPEH